MDRSGLILFTGLVLLALVLAGCGQPDIRKAVDADSRVQSFLSLFPDAKYGETSYTGDQVATIRDVIFQDCGSIPVPSTLVRAAYTTKPAVLVAYVDQNATVLCIASKLNQDAFTIKKGNASAVTNGTLVTVNGEPITTQQVQAALLQLPQETQNQTTILAVINQLIDQSLLRQAAQNLSVADAAVDNATEQAWRAAGFSSEEAFITALGQQNLTYAAVRENVRAQLQVQALLAQEGVTAVTVTPAAAQTYYLNNPDSFLVPEQVRFRQIFLSFNQSGSSQVAQQRLQDVERQLQAGKAFCDVVRQYSDDNQSKDRCGEYTAPRGVLSSELESALFSLGINQTTVVQSANGYHLLVLLNHQPASVIPYSQAESQVMDLLRNAAVQQRLNIYLLKLRAAADIVDYT